MNTPSNKTFKIRWKFSKIKNEFRISLIDLRMDYLECRFEHRQKQKQLDFSEPQTRPKTYEYRTPATSPKGGKRQTRPFIRALSRELG